MNLGTQATFAQLNRFDVWPPLRLYYVDGVDKLVDVDNRRLPDQGFKHCLIIICPTLEIKDTH